MNTPADSDCFSLDGVLLDDGERSEPTWLNTDKVIDEKLVENERSQVQPTQQHHELLDLNPQEQLDVLSSKLNSCKIENGALKAENEALKAENEALKSQEMLLINDLALASCCQPNTQQHATGKRWFALPGQNCNTGSMQLLLDTNAKFMRENSRLEVTVDILRKSFQCHIQESQRHRDTDERIIITLQMELELVQRQLLDIVSRAKRKPSLSDSEHTDKTTSVLDSSFRTLEGDPCDGQGGELIVPVDDCAAQKSADDGMYDIVGSEASSHDLISEDMTISQYTVINARRSSMPTTARKEQAKKPVRRCNTGSNNDRNCLIVEFGDGTANRRERRPASVVQRWHSIK